MRDMVSAERVLFFQIGFRNGGGEPQDLADRLNSSMKVVVIYLKFVSLYLWPHLVHCHFAHERYC